MQFRLPMPRFFISYQVWNNSLTNWAGGEKKERWIRPTWRQWQKDERERKKNVRKGFNFLLAWTNSSIACMREREKEWRGRNSHSPRLVELLISYRLFYYFPPTFPFLFFYFLSFSSSSLPKRFACIQKANEQATFSSPFFPSTIFLPRNFPRLYFLQFSREMTTGCLFRCVHT